MILKPLHVELIILSRFVAMSEELPKRLFKEGEEPRVTQINNNCRIDYIIRKFQAWLPKELDVVKKDPVFHQIFKLHENGLG